VAEAGGIVTEPDEDRSEEYREVWADADRELFPPPEAPLDVAHRLYAQYRLGGKGLKTLLAWRSGFMRWETTHWAEIDSARLRSEIYTPLGQVVYRHKTKTDVEIRPWNPDKRKVANVTEAMQAIGHLSADVDPPSWIDLHSAAESAPAQTISCKNGLLDLSTRELHKHTPAFFNVVTVPFDYQTDAADPVVWLEFLESLWPHDPDSIKLLQEYVGYVLSGRTDMQKMLLLIGPTRSGKGTIARMLTELVGRRRPSSRRRAARAWPWGGRSGQRPDLPGGQPIRGDKL
jgi:putative DNA primase/helicase